MAPILSLDKVNVETSGAYAFENVHPAGHYAYNLPAIRKLLPKGQHKLLDAGCGSGFVSNWLSGLGHKVWGCDYSASGVELAKEHFPDVEYFQADLIAGPPSIMPEGGYDGIVSVEVIEHLYDPEAFLKNLYSAIRPGGFIILTTPYHGYVKNLTLSVINQWDAHFMVNSAGGHIKFFSPATLKSMMEEVGYQELKTIGAGRGPLLWCSMVTIARKPV